MNKLQKEEEEEEEFSIIMVNDMTKTTLKKMMEIHRQLTFQNYLFMEEENCYKLPIN